MLKKAMMLVVAAAALAALTIPAAASAKWAKTVQPGGQVADLATDQQMQITGQINLSAELGEVTCQFVSNVTLTAGTTTANATQFDVDNNGAANDESKCAVDAALGALGCTDVEQVTFAGLPWVAHGIQKTILEITTGTIQAHLTGGIVCPKTLQYTPSKLFIQTKTQWWNAGELSGTVEVHSVVGSQVALFGGETTVSPASTFGRT